MPVDSAIAVVGLAARLPGAPDVATYWRNLLDGVESVTFFDDDELLAAGVTPSLLRHPRYVKAKPFVDGIELFDAGLFGMSAREAELTDPQHRIFLELCATALESAGYAAEHFSGSIGVFAGAGLSAYLLHNLSSGLGESMQSAGVQLGIGNVQDFVATRVAYKLNLSGPAYSVQSACSTSLVAVHLACQNLLGFECDLALAGGVSLSLPVRCGYVYQDEGMLSPDGHCRPFDAAARGTLFGNGAGVVLLKRLEDAHRDGDTIHAIVIGSAVNNDGALKAGFTAPSVAGQAAVITEALANAEVSAESIDYIEAHGTGTVLGDPIEIEGLTRAFAAHTTRRQFCAIGSVKSNIGHLDTAAGIASFIKAVLAVRQGMIPPSLNYDRPNPRIDFERTPFFVNDRRRPWPTTAGPRRAGVSAFGIGGTNAHVVLQEPPAPAAAGPTRSWHILPLAARSAAALETATTNLADFLDDHPDTSIADVAYTMQVGRRTAEQRRVTLARTVDDAIDNLLELTPQQVFTAAARNGAHPLVFMFPGQGSQYAGMGAALYREEPTFRRALDRVCRLLAARLGFDPLALILDDSGNPSAAARLRDADAEQAALFAVEYALAELWRSWGLEPEALIGLSVGECTAAQVAGVMSLEDACSLIAARCLSAMQLPAGAMLAVPMAAAEIRPLLDPSTALALVNTRTACVVSGERDGIAALEARLASRGVVTRRLETSCAYHSPAVDAVLSSFEAAVANLRFHPPRVPFISGATGQMITAAEATDPRYWVRQLRQPVYFFEGIRELLKDASRVFLEVGPGLTLSSLTRQNADPGATRTVLPSLPDQRERRAESQALLTTLAKLWLTGIQVDWTAFHAPAGRRRIPLPTYPMERARYWVEPGAPAAAAQDPAPQRIPDVADWFSIPTWTRRPLTAPGSDRGQTGVRPHGDSQTRARPWLLFAGSDALSLSLADVLGARGAGVTIVREGERFEQLDHGHFAIDLSRAEDYGTLLDRLAADGRLPDRIVHAWSGDIAAAGSADDCDLATAVDRAFYSLLFLGQTLARRPEQPVSIGVVTPAIHVIVGGERALPEAALCLGPATVIPQELAHVSCRHIEVAGCEDQLAATAARICEELEAGDAERRVALRGAYRWVQRHERVRVAKPVPHQSSGEDAPAAAGPKQETESDHREGGTEQREAGIVRRAAVSLQTETGNGKRETGNKKREAGNGERGAGCGKRAAGFKTRGVYLITGGTGGIGLTLASFLAREYQARLMLVSRNGKLSPDAAAALEAAGAEVLTVAAEVVDAQAMQATVAMARARWGRIDGVVHAAGVPGGGLVALKTRDAAARVLAPKVIGTRVLEHALAGEQLDFFVVCSSLAALAGGVGQVDYCAANAFLDAWADARATDGRAALSIDWDAWQQVGMAVNTAVPREWAQARVDQLKMAITPDEGVDVFARLVESSFPQVAVCTIGLETLLRPPVAARPDPHAPAPQRHPRPELTTEYVAPLDGIEQQIAAQWQDVLGLDQVGVNDNFFDLGGDSLTALRVVDRLRDEHGLDFAITMFYAAPTIRLLAASIALDYAGRGRGNGGQRRDVNVDFRLPYA